MSMKDKRSGSVAPKERINISYKPAVGNAKEAVELPFKLLVLGDFTQNQIVTSLEDRKLININKYNFSDVMNSFDLKVQFSVENKITKGNDEPIDISLNINKLSDFEPDSIIQQVDELKKVLELREALKALKGPIGNSPQMRKQIRHLLSDEKSRNELKLELGLSANK
ncbi:type VI secretion system contractile sheath small subunit [Psychromonas sp. MB-3u-54]|nr:type VI secretion system contractile sheath small subunit [Psychromonas sp. MB-3u-54]